MRGLILLIGLIGALLIMGVSCNKADDPESGAAGLAGQMSGGTVGDADADSGESAAEEDY